MNSFVESWKLTDILASEDSDTLEIAHHRFYERFHLAEPTIQAFVDEEDRSFRIQQELNLLRKQFIGNNKPALYGVPIGIKDLFHIDGLPTRAGSQLPPSLLTEQEGSLVKHLRHLGAWIAGKTVTEAFAFGGPISTRNPHAIDHTPGGSSAGSAAAVAAGICPISIGTQTLRSVTAPASFCGVTGYKPSYGRIPIDGAVLLSPSFDTVGIFTSDATSMNLAATHIVPDWKSTLKNNTFEPEIKPVLGIPNGIYMKLMGDDIRSSFDKQVASLANQGYEIKIVNMPWDDDFIFGDAMLRFVQGEMARVHKHLFEESSEHYSELIKQSIQIGLTIEDDELDRYRIGQLKLRHELTEFRRVQGIDLWISPAQGGVAPPHGERTGWPGMTAIWTYTGLPTISLPSGVVNGLPIGFQCIAEFGQDEFLLHHAQQIAKYI